MKVSILHLLFPPTVVILLKRLGWVFLLLTLTRLAFYLFNSVYFEEATVLDFVLGLRFDASTVAYLFSAFIVLSLFAGLLHAYPWYRVVLAVFYFVPLAAVLLMNLADTVYFRFIFRRSTIDVTRYFSGPAADGWRLLTTFALDFWYIPLLWVVLLAIGIWGYVRFSLNAAVRKEGWIFRSLSFLLAIGLIVLAGRGGFQLIPINPVDAGMHTRPANIPLVLNTPFSVLVTAFQDKQQPLHYFDSEEAEKYFSVDYEVKPYSRSFKGKNVVVLIMESFGQEYTGFYNRSGMATYTPFLDSLFTKSYVFVNAFSNGKQSVDAVPAILSGIPALLSRPYTESSYAGNRMPSLAGYFDKLGYRTQFFHGGINGTMGFESFSKSAGIQTYYGRNQYPSVDKDYDGNWGIFDEPYMQYFANELSKNDKPFFSILFSLSSHHPYTIPKGYEGKFPKGEYEIHESIGYADFALKRFFETAKKQPWYSNTLFVITADHTSHSEQKFYQHGQGMGMYAVPIALFDAGSEWIGIDSTVIQHVDLFPTMISLTGGNVKGRFFGRNAFDKDVVHDVLNHNYGGAFNYLQDTTQSFFIEDEIYGVYRFPSDSNMTNNLMELPTIHADRKEKIIKAKLQAYFHHMENNSWWRTKD